MAKAKEFTVAIGDKPGALGKCFLALAERGVNILAFQSYVEERESLVRFIPDCAVLFRRLMSDPRVPRGRKLLLGLLVAYLASPIDLIPDFIPVAGQLDDAILVALVLRSVLRAGGRELLGEHWPGPESSLNALSRLAYGA